MRKHDECETKEDLNKTISSVEDLKLRRLVFPVKKRKSIFDGVDVSELKKRRIDEVSSSTKRDEGDKLQSQKFILSFKCKECSLSFTKFGEFRKHSASH